jgi:uncharacterized damage-inducible protein DinB
MSATQTKTPTPTGLPPATFTRILEEGYGPGAWYGSDLRAAIADVSTAAAFKRPAEGRHNIAEVALHAAFWANEATSRLTGEPRAKFPMAGEDWFALNDESTLTWKKVAATLDAAQQRLSQAASEVASGARTSPLAEAERFDLIVGITGHAAYHAGQIQLIKKMIA